MIEQLSVIVAKKLGVSEETASQAIGIVLAFLDKKGDSSAMANLMDQIPGAKDLMQAHGTPSSSGGLGGLMGGLGGMMGGNAGDLMELAGDLQTTGLSIDQAKTMMPEVTGFMKENVDRDTLKQVMDSVSSLKTML